MSSEPTQVRVNIYLDEPELKREIKIAAANRGVTLSAFCVEAIRHELARDESKKDQQPSESALVAGEALDRLRAEIGPVGIPVRELIDEGRKV